MSFEEKVNLVNAAIKLHKKSQFTAKHSKREAREEVINAAQTLVGICKVGEVFTKRAYFRALDELYHSIIDFAKNNADQLKPVSNYANMKQIEVK